MLKDSRVQMDSTEQGRQGEDLRVTARTRHVVLKQLKNKPKKAADIIMVTKVKVPWLSSG